MILPNPNPSLNPTPGPIKAARPNPRPLPLLKPKSTALTFAPLAWLKLRMFLHADHVEVGFFGISSADDLRQ